MPSMIDAFVYTQIRNMAEKVPSFKTGGTLWFTDLTTADTTYILPLLTAITFIIMVEVGALYKSSLSSDLIYIESKSCVVFLSVVQHAGRYGRESSSWNYEEILKNHCLSLYSNSDGH